MHQRGLAQREGAGQALRRRSGVVASGRPKGDPVVGRSAKVWVGFEGAKQHLWMELECGEDGTIAHKQFFGNNDETRAKDKGWAIATVNPYCSCCFSKLLDRLLLNSGDTRVFRRTCPLKNTPNKIT